MHQPSRKARSISVAARRACPCESGGQVSLALRPTRSASYSVILDIFNRESSVFVVGLCTHASLTLILTGEAVI